MTKYTVSWKSKETTRRLHDNQQPLGFQSGKVDQIEKDRLVASLAKDENAYDVEVEEVLDK